MSNYLEKTSSNRCIDGDFLSNGFTSKKRRKRYYIKVSSCIFVGLYSCEALTLWNPTWQLDSRLQIKSDFNLWNYDSPVCNEAQPRKPTSADIRNTRRTIKKTSYKSHNNFWKTCKRTRNMHLGSELLLPYLSVCTSSNRTEICILLRHFPHGSV